MLPEAAELTVTYSYVVPVANMPNLNNFRLEFSYQFESLCTGQLLFAVKFARRFDNSVNQIQFLAHLHLLLSLCIVWHITTRKITQPTKDSKLNLWKCTANKWQLRPCFFAFLQLINDNSLFIKKLGKIILSPKVVHFSWRMGKMFINFQYIILWMWTPVPDNRHLELFSVLYNCPQESQGNKYWYCKGSCLPAVLHAGKLKS